MMFLNCEGFLLLQWSTRCTSCDSKVSNNSLNSLPCFFGSSGLEDVQADICMFRRREGTEGTWIGMTTTKYIYMTDRQTIRTMH